MGILLIVLLVVMVVALIATGLSESRTGFLISAVLAIVCFFASFVVFVLLVKNEQDKLIKYVVEEQLPVYVDGQEVDIENINLYGYHITIRDGKALLH